MENGLKDIFKDSFLTGAAVSRAILEQEAADETITRHFSSLTAENAMKFSLLQPQENIFDWNEADFIANYARRKNIKMRGHTIIWHNQTPEWLFLEGGNKVSKTTLFKRLENHIDKVSARYNDIVYAWDVLNEAIDTDSSDFCADNYFRNSEWFKTGGREIFEFAFKCMREASPKAKLFYNDYNNESGAKLDSTLRFLSSMLDAGVPIDGVGIQGHWYYNFPDEKTLRHAIESYSALGLEIEFTEVDISAYRWDEAKESADFFPAMPNERFLEQQQRFIEIFKIASEYKSVKNITTWGIADNYTWLGNFPVKNRKNWPLLFDEQYREKPAVTELCASL
ncbi:MAG: endo-1,4-beta-xylanase [Treponema sp.]|nr:endo-1,4-beta-xylanase [Treponema sp.]